MKKSSTTIIDDCNAPMPESVRKAFELAAQTAWISAQKLTHERANAAEVKVAALEKQAEANTAAYTAQTAEYLELRSKSTSAQSEAAADLSAARGEVAAANRMIATMTEEAAQTAIHIEDAAKQLEHLKATLRSTGIAVQALCAESDPRAPAHCASSDCVGSFAPDGQRLTNPVSAAVKASIERRERRQRDEAALIDAAVFLIKTAFQYRTVEEEAAQVDAETSNAQDPVLPL
jgi:regulator of extracellular matrix RemA (YlzA/DUF370 family)